jgi:3-isopropylmalate/(R)-2-methylmalate dehydratase large subunit
MLLGWFQGHMCGGANQEEGILAILTDAGFVLRQPGCSACLAMNDDKVPAGKYSVSTSNRNFEGVKDLDQELY